ncbi:hypothetical protein [Sphingomonas sp. BAUL-RG-20F-R05-02]|uniref:hypothetical protein n=1 Tax=Sphingomonas sp. BAUL-RG-20F-R05-02 TaxID=2914830 RepID=UPI001F589F83|nr:hypothetical protein [Sphingomonas sp. BAUL-RG-20F-R05-02]
MAEDWIVGMAPVPDDVPRSSKQMVESIQRRAGDDFMKPGHVISSIRHFLGDGGTGGRDQGDTRVSEELLRDIHAAGYISGLTAGALDVAGPVRCGTR